MLYFMTPHVQYLKKSRAELTSIIFYVRLFFVEHVGILMCYFQKLILFYQLLHQPVVILRPGANHFISVFP